MTLLGCTGIVRVLRPVTLSLEVHWEDVSELSVAVTQHRDKDTLILSYWNWNSIHFLLSQEFKEVQSVCRHLISLYRLLFILKVALCRSYNFQTLATPSGSIKKKKTLWQAVNLISNTNII